MVPLMSTAVLPNPVNQGSAFNNSFFNGFGDFANDALDLYKGYTQIEAMKDAAGQSQKELSNTVETPNPNPTATPAAQLKQGMAKGLQIGTGTLALVVGGVALLYFLTKK
ncbi:hypothetical protein G3R49_19715 [Shewanella sp. WXL01]|uniref:hypothetical protein n=1 Tax=Shewanella sp. WXL01 TaxID=2709721 RepID=UPI0014386C70|nr:hypothetical protein [Shewanella sp. WXL01]NKF52788.1 hypothetical protein [Shewanella sp. WXL01]